MAQTELPSDALREINDNLAKSLRFMLVAAIFATVAFVAILAALIIQLT